MKKKSRNVNPPKQEAESRATKKEAVAAAMSQGDATSKAIGDSFESLRTKKQLLVIGHITAGRINEAIQEILEPMPLIFTVDVRFADDKTRIAVEEEMFQSVLEVVKDGLNRIKLARPEDRDK